MSQEHPITGKRKRSAKFYAVRISDCKNCSGWPSGTTFFAQRGAWKRIRENNCVLYHDHQGIAYAGRINFVEDDIILTTNVFTIPDTSPVPPMILPRKEIKRCDPVIITYFEEVNEDYLLRRIREEHRLSMMKAASNG